MVAGNGGTEPTAGNAFEATGRALEQAIMTLRRVSGNLPDAEAKDKLTIDMEPFMKRENSDTQDNKASAKQPSNEIPALCATAAVYRLLDRSVVMELNSGVEFAFPVDYVTEFDDASDDELVAVEITARGETLHWPRLGVDLRVADLLAGRFGAEDPPLVAAPEEVELLEHLMAEIEIAWNERRGATLVDQLAASHPQLAIHLYEFLALLLENESVEQPPLPDATAHHLRHWLAEEGYALARHAADEQPPTSTASPSASKDAVESEAPRQSPETPDAAPWKGPTLIIWAVDMTNLEPECIAERAGLRPSFLYLVSQHPEAVPPPVKEEITCRFSQRLGLDERMVRAIQASPNENKKAAMRQTAYASGEITFKKIVSMSGLPPDERTYWLNLAGVK